MSTATEARTLELPPREAPRLEREPATPEANPVDARSPRGRLILAGLAIAFLVSGFAYWRHARRVETTDDAQVDANISAVSARIMGTVTAVQVVDNQEVKAGDLLVSLDPNDLDVALAQAQAQLAVAGAEVGASERDLDQAETQSLFAARERDRGQQLIAKDVIPAANFDQRSSSAAAAAAAALAGKSRLNARRATFELVRAQLRQAELNRSYATIVAPVSGVVGRKSVNVGDRVQPGQQLLFITQTADVWVTAYFRETQVERIRIGQPVVLHVDATSRDYRGRVESFGGATGSRYSLLPPENASGNYVKVVQRLPVRIRFDAGQRDLDRLRPGMSVEPRVTVQ